MPPRVLVVSCGGTISSRAAAPGGGAAPASAADDLVAGLGGLAGLADVSTHSASLVPSSFETLGTALELLALIEGLVDESVAGIVVTHGTDTLEEVAFALDLLWTRDLPLVLTGAMRNASLPGADGPANLMAAIATAVSPDARGLGVLVVLDDRVHAARLVRKAHTTDVGAFVSSTVGPLGFVSENVPRILLAPRRRPTLDAVPERADAQVALLTASLGDDARLLPAVAAAGYAGLVIEAFGGGHLTPAVADSAELDALLPSMPVVVASRTGAGALLHHTYDFAGSETRLRARGLVSAGILDGPKARVLLSLLLALGRDRAQIAGCFALIGSDIGAVR